MPAPVRLFTISNKVNGTCKEAAHKTLIFYLPHVFVAEPPAHYRTILRQSLCFGKWFCARERYKTLHFARFWETSYNTFAFWLWDEYFPKHFPAYQEYRARRLALPAARRKKLLR